MRGCGCGGSLRCGEAVGAFGDGGEDFPRDGGGFLGEFGGGDGEGGG